MNAYTYKKNKTRNHLLLRLREYEVLPYKEAVYAYVNIHPPRP